MPKILYLGIDLPNIYREKKAIHYPIIKISPRSPHLPEISQAYAEFDLFTHVIFTSKNSVRLFFEYAPLFKISLEQIREKVVVAVGQATAEKIQNHGVPVAVIAKEETSEGVVSELISLSLDEHSYLFWPHSGLSRPVISDFFIQNGLKYCSCVFYDSFPSKIEPLPELSEIQEIVFTSPSTIDAFLNIFGKIPKDKSIHCIGPITRNYYKFISQS